MRPLRPRQARGQFVTPPMTYGRSVLGAPLLYFPAQFASADTGLILAGTHGDESASIAALSCALRSLPPGALRHHLVLSMNPDGNQLGVRSNANGVDLNRNFPTQNWQSDGTVYRWNSYTPVRDVAISTGSGQPEPETQALIELIDQLKPRFVVSFHEPLACVDTPTPSPLSRQLAAQFVLPLVADVGYPTPGSFGSWCQERHLECITLELPAIAVDEAVERYLDALIALLSEPIANT